MDVVSGVLTNGIEYENHKLHLQQRNEDLIHRKLEVSWRQTDNIRRKIDEKAQQLKSISHLAALIAGFSTVILIEVTIPAHTNQLLVAAFSTLSTSVIVLMLMSMINCTFIHVGIISRQNHDQDFDEFWRTRCAEDWKISFNAFTLGVFCFFGSLILLGWIVFQKFLAASIILTLIVSVAVAVFVLHTKKKWASLIASPTSAIQYNGISTPVTQTAPRHSQNCQI